MVSIYCQGEPTEAIRIPKTWIWLCNRCGKKVKVVW